MLYAAKCYWPGVTRTELEQVTARVAKALREPGARGVTYRGSLLFSADDLVLCLFEGPSPFAVKRASERAGIPCERVMDSVWLESDRVDLQEPMR
jgi:Nickel responsive protein SCO4226-like